MSNKFWTAENEAKLIDLAQTGMPATDIAAALGCNRGQIFTKAVSLQITVTRWTPAEAAEMAEKTLAHANRSNRAKRDRKRKVAVAPLGASRTSADYRRSLGPAPEMTKGELRRFLHAAVLNTEGARA